ncbi:MAG TPA: glycosyltransferase family 4 protein [Bacteroidia bacterium]|nr:glycosyltransferase family 4 protein [Bacteroidia bacterium]
MKLLILTQYFPPEVGAPQNRLFELAVRLKEAGVDVTVLTAMPNYPKMEIFEGYKDKKYVYEEMEGLKVHRSSIYVSKSKSILNRLRNYFSFVYSSRKCGVNKIGDVDIILCESPPLFLGYSALYLKRKKKAKLVFNVSDLWPESAEKLGVVTNKTMLSLAYKLESKLYNNSELITGQTQGICKSINERFPHKKTYWLPNGVDLNYYDPFNVTETNWREKNNISKNDFVFLYAGIIGIAQGLEIILQAAKLVKDKTAIKFVLLGNGHEKQRLVELKQKNNLNNVIFIDSISKTEMPFVLRSVNAAIVPLKKLDLFKGAIPSKIFESLAMQVPILLGVDGEARELFIEKGKCGLYFEPENTNELIQKVTEISSDLNLAKQLGVNGRNYVKEYFNRNTIGIKLLEQLKKL